MDVVVELIRMGWPLPQPPYQIYHFGNFFLESMIGVHVWVIKKGAFR